MKTPTLKVTNLRERFALSFIFPSNRSFDHHNPVRLIIVVFQSERVSRLADKVIINILRVKGFNLQHKIFLPFLLPGDDKC